MKHHLTRLCTILVVLVPICLLDVHNSRAQEATFGDLAKKLPGNVNAVMAVNVDKISKSPIGVSEKWATSYGGQTASGLMFVPEAANVVLMGAVMDFDAFRPKETAIMITMDQVPPVGTLRSMTDGRVDDINDMEFIETKAGAYVHRASDTLIVGLRPGDRAYFRNWLSDLNKSSTRVKDYLEEGIGFADENAAIIMAFNLEHFVSRSRVYDNIKGMDAVRTNTLDPKIVSKQLASLRGFTLGVTVTDKVTGSVKIDFAEDISSLAPLASEIAQAVLARTGLQLEEFESWEVTSNANQVKLSGSLSTPSLRKIISIVDVPRFDENPYASASESMNSASADTPASLSKKYFDTVNSFYDEIKSKITPGAAYLENAKWLGNYADKIDAMSVLNIDEAVVAYGNQVSQTLRDAGTGLRNTNQTAKEVNQQMLADGTRSGGGFGASLSWGGGYSTGGVGWGEGTNRGDGSRARGAAQKKEKSEAVKSIVGMFSNLDTDRRNVRQAMSQKYGMDF